MSSIKRYAELVQEAGDRNEALTALLDCGLLEGPAEGIAKKIIADKSLDGLSERQRAVYENAIAPQFEIGCSNPDCGQAISMDLVPQALRDEGEDYYCVDCEYMFRDRGED